MGRVVGKNAESPPPGLSFFNSAIEGERRKEKGERRKEKGERRKKQNSINDFLLGI